MKLHEIDPGSDCPEVVRQIVEIPAGSSNKYEYDVDLGLFRLDRALYSPLHYPGDYGFIPGTLADDGDPMDVLTLVATPTFTGCLLAVRPVGLIDMIDAEEADQKVLAVPVGDPRYDQIHVAEQVPPHVRREIEHFFLIYEELEGKRTSLKGWWGPKETREAIRKCRERFLDVRAAVAGPAPRP